MGASLIGTIIRGPQRLDPELIEQVKEDAVRDTAAILNQWIQQGEDFETEEFAMQLGMDEYQELVPESQNQVEVAKLTEIVTRTVTEFIAIWNREWGPDKDDVPRDVMAREFETNGEIQRVVVAGETSWGDRFGTAGGIFDQAAALGIIEKLGCE